MACDLAITHYGRAILEVVLEINCTCQEHVCMADLKVWPYMLD